ncbi:hypothetical protein BER93_12290 [Xanthomonas fragariae]|nr:hypothetical protein BER92_12265 [Xanthomonas fragariae]AOD18774.1 hypothetical protein BER93_12290 [Xanthomonas fragariae]ENZ93522.1 hypothetical protein O1K_20212 [Xanthomonas fragariae LMG 25863]
MRQTCSPATHASRQPRAHQRIQTKISTIAIFWPQIAAQSLQHQHQADKGHACPRRDGTGVTAPA